MAAHTRWVPAGTEARRVRSAAPTARTRGGAHKARRSSDFAAARPIVPGDRGPVRVAECRATIDRLKSDNEQLKEELQLERKNAKAYDSVSAQAQIAKLQDTGDMYTRKIELEKRRIEELDKQMEIMH